MTKKTKGLKGPRGLLVATIAMAVRDLRSKAHRPSALLYFASPIYQAHLDHLDLDQDLLPEVSMEDKRQIRALQRVAGELKEAQDLARRHRDERDALERRRQEITPYGQVRPARASSPQEREEVVQALNIAYKRAVSAEKEVNQVQEKLTVIESEVAETREAVDRYKARTNSGGLFDNLIADLQEKTEREIAEAESAARDERQTLEKLRRQRRENLQQMTRAGEDNLSDIDLAARALLDAEQALEKVYQARRDTLHKFEEIDRELASSTDVDKRIEYRAELDAKPTILRRVDNAAVATESAVETARQYLTQVKSESEKLQAGIKHYETRTADDGLHAEKIARLQEEMAAQISEWERSRADELMALQKAQERLEELGGTNGNL